MNKCIIILLVAVVTRCSGDIFRKLTLNTGDSQKLSHQVEEGTTESKWEIEACDGCKIVLSCVVLSRTCDNHLLTIFDGIKENKYCGRSKRFVLINSYYNKMTVSIMTTQEISGSYCNVNVTRSYTNQRFRDPISTEHGTGSGATRRPSCRCGWANKIPSRIVNGGITAVNEYPFVVLIMLKRTQFAYCGGSIITPYHALTAAHCTYPYQGLELSIAIGEHDRNTKSETPYTRIIEIEKSMDHPQYNDKTNNYDISVLKLKEKIEFNDAVGPVCLPNFSHKNLVGEYVKVMGWGKLKTNGTSSPVLRQVNLKVIEVDICKTIFGSKKKEEDIYEICTWGSGRDSCQGDSGGPLVWRDPETNRYVQVGVVSYGRECGETDPAVNSDVAYFMDFIREKIQESSPQPICV